jgi:uncharacterized lipoprotein YmbA
MLGLAACLVACSSPPQRLYLLNPVQVPQSQHAELAGNSDQARRDISAPLSGIKAGLSVTIPDYLDRPDMLVRSNGNELSPLPDARWAEDLSITTARVMASDLTTALPGADIVAWPTRVERAINYRIAVDLTKFESDASGTVEIEGRWVLLDSRSGATRAGSHFHHTKFAGSMDAKTMAQAMSDLLAMTSAEIATQIQTLRLANGTKTNATVKSAGKTAKLSGMGIEEDARDL